MSATKTKLYVAHEWIERAKKWIIIDAMSAKTFDFVAIGSDEYLHFIYVCVNEYLPPWNIVDNEIWKWKADHVAGYGTLPSKYEVMNIALTGENKAKVKLVEEQFYV